MSNKGDVVVSDPVLFFEGRPLATLIPPELERDLVRSIQTFAAKRGEDAHPGWIAVGLRNGWIHGWHAGFAASESRGEHA